MGQEAKPFSSTEAPAPAVETAPGLPGGERPGRIHWVVVVTRQAQASDKVPPEKYKNKGAGSPDRDGVITRLEPMRLLAHTMTMGGETEVTYQLEARGKDVLLTIVHRRLPTRELSIGVMSGWDVHTGILADVLNGVEPRPFWTTHSKLEKEYAASL